MDAQRNAMIEYLRKGEAEKAAQAAALAAQQSRPSDPEGYAATAQPAPIDPAQSQAAREALISGLTDPGNIPSAIYGAVSPEGRDAWREKTASHPAGIMGQTLSGAAALGPAMGGALAAAGTGAGFLAGSDVLDETVGGVHGAVDADTGYKAMLGAAGPMAGPMAKMAGAAPRTTATGVGAATWLSSDAQGDDMSAGMAQRRKEIRDTIASEQEKLRSQISNLKRGVVDKNTRDTALIRKLQKELGLTVDGKNGANTRGMIETRNKTIQSQISDIENRLREISAPEYENSRISAAERGAFERQLAAKRDEAQLPFIERNPDYPYYAMPIAAATAGLAPQVTARMLRNYELAPAKAASRAVDAAAKRADSARASGQLNSTDTAAAGRAARDFDRVAASGDRKAGRFTEAGAMVAPVVTGASAMTAANTLPSVIDYSTQAPGTTAYEAAQETFTPEKFVERWLGPGALGATIAGGSAMIGKAVNMGRTATPRGDNLARAQAYGGMSGKGAVDDAAAVNAVIAEQLRGTNAAAVQGSKQVRDMSKQVEAERLRGTRDQLENMRMLDNQRASRQDVLEDLRATEQNAKVIGGQATSGKQIPYAPAQPSLQPLQLPQASAARPQPVGSLIDDAAPAQPEATATAAARTQARQQPQTPQKAQKSASSKPPPLSQKQKDRIKEAYYQKWQQNGSGEGVDAVALGIPLRGASMSKENVNAYLTELRKLGHATGHSKGRDRVATLKALRDSGVKFGLPATASAAALDAQLRQDTIARALREAQ